LVLGGFTSRSVVDDGDDASTDDTKPKPDARS
jgi:hypothetical protein